MCALPPCNVDIEVFHTEPALLSAKQSFTVVLKLKSNLLLILQLCKPRRQIKHSESVAQALQGAVTCHAEKAVGLIFERTYHIAAIACSQLLGVAYAHQLPIYKDSQPVTKHLHSTASFQ